MLADLLKEKKLKSAVEGYINSTDMYFASLITVCHNMSQEKLQTTYINTSSQYLVSSFKSVSL